MGMIRRAVCEARVAHPCEIVVPISEPRREAMTGHVDLGSGRPGMRGDEKKMAQRGEERTRTGRERKEDQGGSQQKGRRHTMPLRKW